MGVDTTFYTVYGVKVPWDDTFSEVYEEVYEDPDTPWILLDSMTGEYMIFGVLLFNSGSMRWGFEGDQSMEISLDNLDRIAQVYCRNFAQCFPKFEHLVKQEDFKLMSVVHYS